MPNLAAEELAAADLNMAQVLKEHAIATLRLAYDHAVQVVHFQPWSYEHLGTPYRFQLGAKQFFRQDLNVNYDNLRGTFINGWPVRYEVQLLADSMNPNVPLQFRYLSLYKILELRFKTKGRWRLADYERFLERFRGEYARLGVSKMSPRRYIEQLRNRCVHIRSNRDVLGVTMLSNKDAAEVQNALPLVTAMCAEAINRDDRVKGFRLMRSSVDPKDSNLGSAD